MGAIDIRRSFFEIGGHSLMATLVVAALRRELGINLSIATLFQHPSVKEIAATISEDIAQSVSKSKAESVGANAIIVLNDAAPGPTLFLFPESTGFASIYSSLFSSIDNKLVAFGDERWGEAPNSDESIESIVSAHISTIRKHQTHGPYYLAGWSLGGYMAFEAARQLLAAGEEVAIVIMFDSSVYDRPLGEAQWRPELDHLLTIVDDKSSWLNQFSRSNRLISKYRPLAGAYSGRAVLVKADKGRDPSEVEPPPPDALNGWGRILPQVEVVHIDSTHKAMFDSVNGRKVGRIVRDLIA